MDSNSVDRPNIRSASGSATWFFIILAFLFVAAVNFVGLSGRSEDDHKAGGRGGDRTEGNEHSTPNDPATRYHYQPSATGNDSAAH